jgi:3-(3-hydroxy-phenyl)propionate hydroxylase
VRRRDRAAGRLCPQPRVRVNGAELPVDEVLGTGFAIVSRRDGVAAFDPATRAYFDTLDTRVVTCENLDSGLGALLDRAGADALLVRPDRVVAASADRPDLRTWRRLLESAGIGAR